MIIYFCPGIKAYWFNILGKYHSYLNINNILVEKLAQSNYTSTAL